MEVQQARQILTGKAVLVVEDDDLQAELVAESIEQAGGTIVGPASTEEEARKLIAAAPVEVAVLDIVLQNGTSLGLAMDLRDRGVEVIMMTGYRVSDVPDGLSDAPTFHKPFNLQTLVDKIAKQTD